MDINDISYGQRSDIRRRIVWDAATGCWLWKGARTDNGYGLVRIKGRKWRIHRWVWAITHGEEPEGDVHHTCGNRLCVTPEHLQGLTHAEHASVTRHGLRYEECRRGHPLTEDNVYVRHHPDGSFRDRQCRTCRADARRQ